MQQHIFEPRREEEEIRALWKMAHQSCLLLTSREKLTELEPLEGSRPIRSLRLTGLETEASEELLAEKEVVGHAQDRARLIEVYAGNPVALNIVAQTIVELFEGEIAPLLEQGEVIFGSVRELLDEQFARLSASEQALLRWLAILREPVSLEELRGAGHAARAPRCLKPWRRCVDARCWSVGIGCKVNATSTGNNH